ncbi:MAG TPA: hypothetical protein VFE32_04810 [Puia sp.]|jgi:hypothetical protein|nr:hypothetical protein [Puia sp.]
MALDRFDGLLGGDPFLDFYRALIYQMMNNPLQSRLALERVHAHFPLFAPASGKLVDAYMLAARPDSAAMVIKEAQHLNEISPDQLEAVLKIYPALRRYLK